MMKPAIYLQAQMLPSKSARGLAARNRPQQSVIYTALLVNCNVLVRDLLKRLELFALYIGTENTMYAIQTYMPEPFSLIMHQNG